MGIINQNRYQKYKYRILELLNGRPHEEYKIAKNRLPIAIKVNPRTFRDWCYITKDEERTIPADKLYQIAEFLEVPMKDMFTNPPEGINYEQMRLDYYDAKSSSYNL